MCDDSVPQCSLLDLISDAYNGANEQENMPTMILSVNLTQTTKNKFN